MKGFPRLDMVFDPHPIEHIKHTAYIKGRPTHDRIDWLRTNTKIPIYMQEAYPEVPMAQRYPIEDVIRLRGGKEDLTSTLALMMAYAILQEPERIYIYGFNLMVEYEYLHQLPGAKFWKGFAEGRGIEVIGPPESKLFESTKVYGYEGTSMITRRTLKKHQKSYQLQAEQNKKALDEWNGALAQRMNGFINPKTKRIMGNHKLIQEAQDQVRIFDTQLFGSRLGVEIFDRLLKEVDLIEVEPVEIKVKEILRGK